MSTTTRSGCSLVDGVDDCVAVAFGGDDLVAAVDEQAGEAFAQQDLVLGDHDTHGSSALMVVPWPLVLSISSRPPRAATRSDSPVSPDPRSIVAPPTPSSATLTISVESWRTTSSRTLVARGVLGGVGQSLAGHEVRGSFDVGRVPVAGGVDGDGHR